MANLFKKYETNVTLEREGVDVTIEDCVFTIKRAGGNNRAYRYALAKIAAKNPDVFNEDIEEGERFNLHEDLQIEACASSILCGWKNVMGRDNKPLIFNEGNALDLLKTCPDIWDQIKEAAADESLFKATQGDGEELGKY